MSRIVVLGDLNLDVLAEGPEGIPVGGEVRTLVQAEPGGSAGRFASIAAREGAAVTFIGCVGNDLVGDLLIRSLQDEGVTPHVMQVDAPTGTIVSLAQGSERTMLCSRGANDGIETSWVKEECFRGANDLHLSGYTFLSHSQQKATHRAIEIARAFGMKISIDPPPANLIRAFGVDRFLHEIAGLDWLFPNLDEGKTLSGEEMPEEIVGVLGESFCVGALTLGEKGSLAWKGDERDRRETEEMASADSTGAGDAFAAGFVVAYLESGSLAFANRRGNATAHRLLSTHTRRPAQGLSTSD